ncbi:MAG TPA: family 65 glycosyl hydrolase, partial [Cryomorphaceae bacterium]|nr:family 65 glycosyl hydrolase [Cryomorphaceae bacterium]
LNSCNWIGIQVKVDGEELDLNTASEVASFCRELDMHSGLLKRTFEATLPSGKIVAVEAERLVSIVQDEIGTISYSVTPKNFSGKIELCSYLDFDVENEDSNYDEKFWEPVTQGQEA